MLRILLIKPFDDIETEIPKRFFLAAYNRQLILNYSCPTTPPPGKSKEVNCPKEADISSL